MCKDILLERYILKNSISKKRRFRQFLDSLKIRIKYNNPLNNDYIDGNNCLIISISKKLFNYNRNFIRQFKKLKNKIKNSKKLIKNKNNSYLPGEIENHNFKISFKKGIKYHEKIIKNLNDLAKNKLDFKEEDLL